MCILKCFCHISWKVYFPRSVNTFPKLENSMCASDFVCPRGYFRRPYLYYGGWVLLFKDQGHTDDEKGSNTWNEVSPNTKCSCVHHISNFPAKNWLKLSLKLKTEICMIFVWFAAQIKNLNAQPGRLVGPSWLSLPATLDFVQKKTQIKKRRKLDVGIHQ